MTERASIRYVPGTALSAAVTALAAHQPRWTLTDGGRSIVSSNFARFFQAHMPARAARAAEIIAAAKLVTRDAAAGAGTYDVDPDEEAKEPHYAFDRAVQVFAGFHLIADEFLALVLVTNNKSVQECLDKAYPKTIRGIEMYDATRPRTVARMVERANDMREECDDYTEEQLAVLPSYTAADIPPGLKTIDGSTWRHLHQAADTCRDLMVEWFQDYCVCLFMRGDVMEISE